MKKIMVLLSICLFSPLIVAMQLGASDSGTVPALGITQKQAMPSTVHANEDAIAIFTITNNFQRNTIPDINLVLPPYVTQRTGVGACNFPIAQLRPGETCQFMMVLNSPQVGYVFHHSDAHIIYPGRDYPLGTTETTTVVG